MHKFRNVPTTVGAESYRSKREAARHQELLLLQRAGEIAGLTREVPFVLAPATKIGSERAIPPLRYLADFVYCAFGKIVVEDCKGFRTPVYRIKRHLMKTVHDVEVLET